VDYSASDKRWTECDFCTIKSNTLTNFGSIISVFILILLISIQSNLAQTLPKWSDPVNLQILNTSEDDFAPSWNQFENVLYFNSTLTGYSKFYYSKELDTGKFSIPELVPGEINQPVNNQSYITFASEDRAYISTYRMGSFRPYTNIFQTIKKKMSWTKPLPADSLIYDTFVSQPTISPDGSFMVFVNTINSEHKDTDLWLAFLKDNGTWGALTPISELNTNGNEITPFLATNDTLYFASDGQEGPGGFDLFYSVRKQGLWQKPIPIKELNTKFDESDFVILPTGEAIFASDRQGGKGNLDLYITVPEVLKKKEETYLPPIELSIASQVSTIRTNTELYYRLMPLIPLYYPSPSRNHFLQPNEFSLAVLEPVIDTITAFTLPIIAKRAQENEKAKITIIPLYPDITRSEEISKDAEKIKKYFIEVWSVPEKNLTILPAAQNNNITEAKKAETAILFSSDSPDIFEPLSLGRFTVTLDPPVLDISINGRPNGLIGKWECNLFVNNKYVKVVSQGNSLPNQYSVDLNPIKNELIEADSIKINFTAIDTIGRTNFKSMIVNLAHSSNKSKEFRKYDNKIYDEFFLFLKDASLKDNMIYLKSSIEKISESGSYSRFVTISYFSDILQSASKELSDIITRNISDRSIKIETYREDYNESLPFSRSFLDNIIKIRIEKPIQN